MLGVDVSDAGTGISFSPATQYEHKSGDAVQALGSGITLEIELDKSHEVGAAVVNPCATFCGLSRISSTRSMVRNTPYRPLQDH